MAGVEPPALNICLGFATQTRIPTSSEKCFAKATSLLKLLHAFVCGTSSLHSHGCVPMVAFRWLRSYGCVPMAAFLWLRSRGCVPVVAIPMVAFLWFLCPLFSYNMVVVEFWPKLRHRHLRTRAAGHICGSQRRWHRHPIRDNWLAQGSADGKARDV